jgi:hypothetical protein
VRALRRAETDGRVQKQGARTDQPLGSFPKGLIVSPRGHFASMFRANEKYAQQALEASRSMSDPEDDYDFPPTAHPGRELFTAIFFTVLILAFLVWGIWKLISII